VDSPTIRKKLTIIPPSIHNKVKKLPLTQVEKELLFGDLATLNSLDLMEEWLGELEEQLLQKI